MRYYRHRRKASKKAKRIFFRILFILAAAAVVTGLAILTGNLLLARVERAEAALESSIPPSGNVAGREDDPEDMQSTSDENRQPLQVFAGGLDLTLADTEDGLFSRLNSLAQTYNTISVNVSDRNGLLYVSSALSTLVGMPETGVNTEAYTRLTQLITAAKAQDLRLCAVMPSSLHRLDADTAALLDSTVAAELYTLGFDEIMLTDLLFSDADTDDINIARRYLNDVHDALSGTGSFLTGVCLPVSIYLDAGNAKQVQLLASSVDFLAMSAANTPTAGDIALTLEEICTSLTGSFEVYDLRVVLDTDDIELLGAQYNSLVRQGISNIHFLDEIHTDDFATPALPEEETTVEETTAEETIPTTNPYVTTNPGDGTTPGGGTVTEPEETYYRTEEGSWF